MNTVFKNIGLICKPDAPDISQTIQQLCHLLTSLNINFFTDHETARHIKIPADKVMEITALAKNVDLVMSIGGDGTLLGAARNLVNEDIPLIGINLGRLGFLVDISPEEMNFKIKEILAGEYHEEERIILNAQIIRNEQTIYQHPAFNEVALHRLNSPGLIEIETHVDNKFVNSQRSDGLIIASPTGSSAYALSCGGPLMHPSLDAIVLAPINPHTLSNRPIVVDGRSTIDINFSQRDKHQAQLTCDNIVLPDLVERDRIRIQRNKKKIRLLHPKDHDFYLILRAKLNWSNNP